LFSEALRKAGCPEPIEYAADRLTLYLDMLPTGNGDEVRLVELEGLTEATSSSDQEAAREVDR
jgi:hypothetical protein